MRTKIIDLNDQDYPLAKGEQRITPFVLTNQGYEPDDRRQKTAACDDAIDFANKIDPEKGKRVILVSAVGDFEHYEGNKKADAFPQNAILGTWPADVSRDFFSRLQVRIPKKWGYQCFTTVFNEAGHQIGGGNTFYEHMNRFPKHMLGQPVDIWDKSDARCGNILASFWNPKMHRVEIIQEVWESKLPRIVAAIDRGELPGISMACDIPFDRCFECGNLAVTAKDYCEHLNRFSNPRGAIFPGRKAAIMLNDFPVFFDSTITANPAAVEGRTLMKVANTGLDTTLVYPDYFAPDTSFLGPDQKLEEEQFIEKNANCNCEMLQDMRENEPALPDRIIQSLQQMPLEKVLMYLGLLGIVPKASELIGLLFNDFSQKAQIEGNMIERILPKVVSKRIIISVTKAPPISLSMPAFSDSEFNSLAEKIASYVPSKSYAIPYLMSRHKQASVMNVPLNVNNLSERARLIILIKSLLDPATRCIIEEVTKDPRVLRSLREKNLYQQDLKQELLPLYDFSVRPSHFDKFYGG